MAGAWYFAGALLLGLAYLYHGVLASRIKTTLQARKLLQASIFYLPLVYVLLVVDRI